MRVLILAVSMMMASSSAVAQGQNLSPVSLGSAATRLESENRANMNTRGRDEECLVRKATGKRECRTRSEWRKIAKQLSPQTRQVR
jgi:hypothetical protein